MINRQFHHTIALVTTCAFLVAGCSGGSDGTTNTGTPAITLAATPTTLTVARNATGTVQLTLGRSGNYTGAVSFAAEGLPAGVTASFAPPSLTSGTTSALSVDVGSTAQPGTSNFTVRATGDGVTAKTVQVSLTIPAPTMALQLGASTAAVTQGASATVPVTITRTNGFNGAVTLTALGLPTGVTASFAPSPITGTGTTSTLTLTASGNATLGNAEITVRAAGADVADKTATFTLTVNAAAGPDFSLSAAPAAHNIVAGANAQSTVTISRTGGFAGAVALVVEGAPDGVTATLNPAAATTGTSTLTVATTAATAAGTYDLTIRGTGTGITGSRTTQVSLTVSAPPGLTLALSAAALSVGQGEEGQTVVTVTRTGGLAGNVTLALEGAPAGVTGTFNPNPATGSTSTLTLDVAGSTAVGTYNLTVRGTGTGNVTITTPLQLTVTSSAAAVQILRSSSYLLVGDTLHLTGRVVDDEGQPVTGAEVTFSAGDGASIDGGNVLTALAPGDVTVTATSGSVNGTATLYIAAGGGMRVSALSLIDSLMIIERDRLDVPAVSVAISRNGSLLFARSYGYADTATRRVAQPNQMYRVGSTSKALTAVAIMRLVQDGQLTLDSRPFTMLQTEIPPRAGHTEDTRLGDITVRDLLQHSGGWHPNRAVDDSVWAAVWRDGILDQYQMARYGRSVPLATDPGTAHAYNNYSYQVLGRLIEKVTGKTYEQYVRDAILEPAGVTAMKLGRTPLAMRDPLEVTCYSTLPNTTGTFGTGRWCDVVAEQEYSEASGSWIASATDMVRWMSVVDGFTGPRADVLTSATINSMTARPSYAPAAGYYYALGWEIMPEAGGLRWYHAGAQTGGDGYIARFPNGVVVAILANRTRPVGGETLEQKLLPLIQSISNWPGGTPF